MPVLVAVAVAPTLRWRLAVWGWSGSRQAGRGRGWRRPRRSSATTSRLTQATMASRSNACAKFGELTIAPSPTMASSGFDANAVGRSTTSQADAIACQVGVPGRSLTQMRFDTRPSTGGGWTAVAFDLAPLAVSSSRRPHCTPRRRATRIHSSAASGNPFSHARLRETRATPTQQGYRKRYRALGAPFHPPGCSCQAAKALLTARSRCPRQDSNLRPTA
jgi:hypothetical protein